MLGYSQRSKAWYCHVQVHTFGHFNININNWNYNCSIKLNEIISLLQIICIISWPCNLTGELTELLISVSRIQSPHLTDLRPQCQFCEWSNERFCTSGIHELCKGNLCNNLKSKSFSWILSSTLVGTHHRTNLIWNMKTLHEAHWMTLCLQRKVLWTYIIVSQ